MEQERTELAEENGMEDGSSSLMSMVDKAKMVKPEPEEKVVKGTDKQGTTKDKEFMEKQTSKKVAEESMEKPEQTSKKVAEDETSSSSWMQMVAEAKMLVLQSNEESKKLDDLKRWTRPSIYRVPDWLKGMTKAEAYKPQVVSLGPFHHGELSLQPMEEHKRRLMEHMVRRSQEPLSKFIKAIEEVSDELHEAYDGLDKNWRGKFTYSSFEDVMVRDGGFLLEFMTTVTRTRNASEAGYEPYDPIFSERGLLSLWPRIRSDMILVENQVPLLALKKLEAVRRGTDQISDAYINELVTDFICPNLYEIRNQEKLGLHTLQTFHRKFCGGHSQPLKQQDEWDQSETTMRSAEELREAGVHFKRSDTRSVRDIKFENGVLSMPLVEINDSSERMFLNLMAFERLHSDAGNVATDYMIFMDNIIDSERDVALLRNKKVLRNFMSSDKAAADLFNTLVRGATLNPFSKVSHVQWQVHNHCERRWPKLKASFKYTYMRNPWVFFSAVAAIILLALTILQTVYTVVPFYTKN